MSEKIRRRTTTDSEKKERNKERNNSVKVWERNMIKIQKKKEDKYMEKNMRQNQGIQ